MATPKKRDMISLKDYKNSEIRQILDLTREVKNYPKKFENALERKELALIFQKTSTRTRVSFEVGMHQLGGNSIYLDWRTTNFTLGSLEDEVKCLDEYVDIIMARVYGHDDVVRMAAEYGVTKIIQPGGSIRDKDSIKACNELGIKMVFTKNRHFKH